MVQTPIYLLTLVTLYLLTTSVHSTMDSSGDPLSTNTQQDEVDSSQSCPLGCLTCSKWNGCVACDKDFAWHLEKVFMRTIGVCLRECPTGYSKQSFHHAPEHLRCTACEAANCAMCSIRSFCDRCREPYLEYRGTCILTCPHNLYHSQYRRDCYEQVDCLVQSWSVWSECLRSGKSCGYKWGNQTRTRVILQHPSANGNLCPSTEQTQRCKLKERYCNSVKLSSGPVMRQRHERQREKRKRRCRLLKRSGRICKGEENYHISDVIAAPPQTTDNSHFNSNISSYYDYYRQSAELLQLLNLKKSLQRSRRTKDLAKDNIDPG